MASDSIWGPNWVIVVPADVLAPNSDEPLAGLMLPTKLTLLCLFFSQKT